MESESDTEQPEPVVWQEKLHEADQTQAHLSIWKSQKMTYDLPARICDK